jgi:hypothetical protein
MPIVLSIIERACEKSQNYCFFLNKPTYADWLMGNIPFAIGSYANYTQNNLMLLKNGEIIDTVEPEAGPLSLAEILAQVQT